MVGYCGFGSIKHWQFCPCHIDRCPMNKTELYPMRLEFCIESSRFLLLASKKSCVPLNAWVIRLEPRENERAQLPMSESFETFEYADTVIKMNVMSSKFTS